MLASYVQSPEPDKALNSPSGQGYSGERQYLLQEMISECVLLLFPSYWPGAFRLKVFHITFISGKEGPSQTSPGTLSPTPSIPHQLVGIGWQRVLVSTSSSGVGSGWVSSVEGSGVGVDSVPEFCVCALLLHLA